jgi:hypothetical protein
MTDKTMRGPAQKSIRFTLTSAERPRVVCNLLRTEPDSSIRRIHHPSGAAPLRTPARARFCKGASFANSKLTHYLVVTLIDPDSRWRENGAIV